MKILCVFWGTNHPSVLVAAQPEHVGAGGLEVEKEQEKFLGILGNFPHFLPEAPEISPVKFSVGVVQVVYIINREVLPGHEEHEGDVAAAAGDGIEDSRKWGSGCGIWGAQPLLPGLPALLGARVIWSCCWRRNRFPKCWSLVEHEELVQHLRVRAINP